VRERWLSRRALFLHVGCLLFVPFCIAATWWQITRAEDGNGLSYLYTFEWPVFAIVGIYFWWQFLHTDYETVGLKGMRNQSTEAPTSEVATDTASDSDSDSARHLVPAASSATVASATPATPLSSAGPSTSAEPATSISPATPPSPPSRPTALEDEDPDLAAYNARLAALSNSGGKTWRKPEIPIARMPQ
jgi:hypothetical protein